MTEARPLRKVLLTADSIGGVWTYALELARGLASRKVEVVLATMGAPATADQRHDAFSIPGLQLHESRWRLEWMADAWEDVDRAGKWLLELEEKTRPDVIHLNGFAHGHLRWTAPTLIAGHSCVLSWWEAVKGESAPPCWNEYRRRVTAGLCAASEVVAPTRAMLGSLQTQYGPLPPCRVISNGRYAGRFPTAGKKPLILAAGRLGDEAKNIRALGIASEGLPWPTFVAGKREDASGHNPVPAALRSLGLLSEPALAEWMSRAAIYCLPARYEPFGLSILEAALAGCALVLGDISSLRELWDGVAVFVPPNDPAALREALQGLIEDPGRRLTIAMSGRERGLEFTPDRMVNAYLDAYGSLLRNRSTPAVLS